MLQENSALGHAVQPDSSESITPIVRSCKDPLFDYDARARELNLPLLAEVEARNRETELMNRRPRLPKRPEPGFVRPVDRPNAPYIPWHSVS